MVLHWNPTLFAVESVPIIFTPSLWGSTGVRFCHFLMLPQPYLAGLEALQPHIQLCIVFVHPSFSISHSKHYISLPWCLPRYCEAFQGQYSTHIAFLVPYAYAAPMFDPVTARLVFPQG